MGTQPEHRIEAGQEYLACRPTPSIPGEHYTRIRVICAPSIVSHRPRIVTVHAGGSTSNPRTIDPRKLHPTGTRGDGHRRVTGYLLVRNADGSAA
jgi:hypothetical protein